MHPSMEDGDDGYDAQYGSSSQRGGTTPSYTGGFSGTPYRPDKDYSKLVRLYSFWLQFSPVS